MYSDASKTDTEKSDLDESIASSTVSMSSSTITQSEAIRKQLSDTQCSMSESEKEDLLAVDLQPIEKHVAAKEEDPSNSRDSLPHSPDTNIAVNISPLIDQSKKPSSDAQDQSLEKHIFQFLQILKNLKVFSNYRKDSSYANDFSSEKEIEESEAVQIEDTQSDVVHIEDTDGMIQLIGKGDVKETSVSPSNDEKIEQLFEKSRKVDATDLLDDNEADLSATREISLAESSLVEMLNIYESKKIERSIEAEFRPHISAPIATSDFTENKINVTFKKPKSTLSKKIKAKPVPEQKKNIFNKTMDWSHVKGSGYGPNAVKKVLETKPKISPRLHAKVENVKRERKAKLVNSRLREYFFL